jgi:hypothetical protein
VNDSKRFFDVQVLFFASRDKKCLTHPETPAILIHMNWTETINDLLQRGYTFASIGREIGTTGAAVRAMMRNQGQQPRWSTGQKVIDLHKKTMRKFPRIDTTA